MTIERTRLSTSAAGVVEDVRAVVAAGAGPEGFSPDFQVCFPYRGLFVWQANRDDVVGDPNQVLFVTGGEPYRMRASSAIGYAELIITPAPEILSEMTGVRVRDLARHPLFVRRSWRADACVHRLRASMLHRASAGDLDELSADEHAVALLHAALQVEVTACAPGGRTRRLIQRTKEYLGANACARLRLRDVADAVDASPAYLTDVFRRAEGVPLHRYVVELRLARALVELPHANDLTALAFDLGFSSHSHFSASFRRAFGCTPSQFRESTRVRRAR
ncbi:MAG TPA: AraC family transcriptional regulator [Vicinamibacterales bacterium]|nr:AraC family transcriptional regulator [Vicinamibacterales bacterium]